MKAFLGRWLPALAIAAGLIFALAQAVQEWSGPDGESHPAVDPSPRAAGAGTQEAGGDLPESAVEGEEEVTEADTTAAADRVTVTQAAPTVERLREEVARSPHETPPSLRDFAQSMAVRMELAKSDPVRARRLIGELGDCVGSSSQARTVRSICLMNSARLAGFRPEVQDEAARIAREAPREVTALSEASRGAAQ